MNSDDYGKKRILFIMSSLAGGGAERVTANLVNALCEKYEVSLITLFEHRDAYELDPRVQRFHYPEFYVNTPRLRRKFLKAAGHLPRLLWVRNIKNKLKPDVTVSMLYLPNCINALCDSGDFRIMSERADPTWMGKNYYNAGKFAYGRADHTVFQSRRVQRMFADKVQAKSSIILNPVKVDCLASAQKARKIVTAGRLEDQKNHKLLIRAFSSFHRHHPGYHLYIFGEGSLKSELLRTVKNLGMQDSVSILDFAPDLHEQIRDAEMFVLSSDFEGLSNALLEAMMMGIPCISTNCAGSDEVIENMKNGILVPVGDEHRLAEAMSTIADDPVMGEAFAKAGREVSERFRAETVIRQWIDLIERNI